MTKPKEHGPLESHAIEGLTEPQRTFEVRGKGRWVDPDAFIDKMTKGHVLLQRILTVTLHSGGSLGFTVKDVGPGMAATDSRVLDPECERVRFHHFQSHFPMIVETVLRFADGMSPEAFQSVLWAALKSTQSLPQELLEWMPELGIKRKPQVQAKYLKPGGAEKVAKALGGALKSVLKKGRKKS